MQTKNLYRSLKVGSINSHRVMYYLWVFDVLSSFCFLSAQYCQFFQSHSPLCSFKKLSLCTRNKIKNLTKPINRPHLPQNPSKSFSKSFKSV